MVMSFLKSEGSLPVLSGLPGSLTNLLIRAVPNHPGELNDCLCLFLRRQH